MAAKKPKRRRKAKESGSGAHRHPELYDEIVDVKKRVRKLEGKKRAAT